MVPLENPSQETLFLIENGNADANKLRGPLPPPQRQFLGVVVHVGKFPRCERLTYLSDKTVVFHVVGNVNGCAFLCQPKNQWFFQ